MATIIQAQEEKRRNKINTLIASIRKVFKAGLEIDYERLIGESCLEFGASRRHIMELIEIALTQVDYEFTKKDGRKIIRDSSNAETDSK